MLDEVFVFEGPVDREKKLPTQSLSMNQFGIYDIEGPKYFSGGWTSDAEKRTDILREAQAWNCDGWALWLDSDEILLYGEYLHEWCERADLETGTGGTAIRIVEYDGSVAQCYGKLIKLDSIHKYIMSSYEVELSNGITVALPNVPICSAGGIPIGEIKDRDDPLLALNRPPVIGEPHLLHRHGLRDPERKALRLHEKEAEDFQSMVDNEKRGN